MRKHVLFASLLALLPTVSICQEKRPVEPVIQELSKFVGGSWSGAGDMAPVQEWTWQHDKRGLIIRTTIGGGTSNERIFNAYLGYDPITKKASYLDIHDSETTYSGHITLEDGFVVFRFGRIGSGKVEWVERGKFTNINLWESALYSVKEGKESLAHSFKLSRKIAK